MTETKASSSVFPILIVITTQLWFFLVLYTKITTKPHDGFLSNHYFHRLFLAARSEEIVLLVVMTNTKQIFLTTPICRVLVSLYYRLVAEFCHLAGNIEITLVSLIATYSDRRYDLNTHKERYILFADEEAGQYIHSLWK